MVESENPRKFPVFWIVIFLILAIIFFWLWLRFRKQGIIKVLFIFWWVIFAIAIIGLIVFVVVWLLKKHRIDMIRVTKQRIVKACQLCPPKQNQELWFIGSHELEHRYIGNVIGVAKAKSEPVFKEYEDKSSNPPTKKMKQVKPSMDLTFIAFKQPVPFPLSLFNIPKVFCGLTWKNNGQTYSDFTHLSSNIIYLKGMTFAPELYGIYFLSQHFKDTFMVDEVISQLIYRYVLQDNLSEIKNIVDDALGISPTHRKIMERTKVHEITGGYVSPPQPPQQ